MIRALLARFWNNEAAYLAERKRELQNEQARIARDIQECERRLRRAEIRQLQYARLS